MKHLPVVRLSINAHIADTQRLKEESKEVEVLLQLFRFHAKDGHGYGRIYKLPLLTRPYCCFRSNRRQPSGLILDHKDSAQCVQIRIQRLDARRRHVVLYIIENCLRGSKRRYVTGKRTQDKAHQCGISFHTIHAMDVLVDHGLDVIDGFLVCDARALRKNGLWPSATADEMRIVRH